MNDYIFLMHDDATNAISNDDWEPYLARLQSAGVFQGGSAIGGGACVRKSEKAPPLSAQISGFIRVTAEDLAQAKTLLVGNPVYEAGGTVEIRELPRT